MSNNNPKWQSLPTPEQLSKVKTREDLHKLVDLKTMIQALNYYRTNKKSHHNYNLRKSLIYKKAVAAGFTAD